MSKTDLALAVRLIETQRTMVLGTAEPHPWTAPVYYLYDRRRFYFFSNAASRHVTAALNSGRCASSIFRDSEDWREIEGLQMDGKLARISPGPEAFRTLDAYLQKFPTVKDLFVGTLLDFRQFTARFRSQLYAFLPEHVFYLNNRAGLGTRKKIQLPG